MKHLNKIEKKALEYLKEQLEKKLGSSFIGLKLYGSKARGDYHEESDIDLIIVVEKKEKSTEDIIYNSIADTLLKYEIYFSAMIYSKKKIKQMKSEPTFFFQTIKKDLINV